MPEKGSGVDRSAGPSATESEAEKQALYARRMSGMCPSYARSVSALCPLCVRPVSGEQPACLGAGGSEQLGEGGGVAARGFQLF